MRRRVEVLVHGVDVGAVAARRSERTEARSELGLDDEDFVVVTVANLRSHKDYPTMLRAARRLANDGVPCKFLAVGRGPLASELEALRDELGLGERFRFLGHRSDPIRVLVAGDAFCLSSMFEGLPIAMVEAMAVGLPVVATEVGGIPTLATGDTAITIVPPQSPDELADALHELHAMLRAEPDAGARNRPAAPDIKTAIRALQAVYMS